MLKLLILASIGAIIGWMTNVIAIKLMFRPVNPIGIKGTPFVIQGLIPKRKAEIAKSIGDVISDELISIEKIVDKMITDMDKQQIINLIKQKVMVVANEKMPSIIPSMFKGMILQNIEQMIDENGEQIIVELGEQLSHKAIESINISKMVEDQINAYDFEKIEEMTLKIAKTELKHIEVLGGVIGFFIGIFQGVIVLYALK
ncbi:DUF445 family protein [Fusibacter bizertensis]|jgi:Uncharacterized protein conserved in bacteria|uniref:DUF445 family protein n=1 Tax=Fusibacter bizertensis TaxID=1488331 RepID=A0ABT6NAY1_9FIRM|nr:DUF445 family protein [Fusibacter bizertensis]MDH8677577.1 DUF445 family protein [Fusibacter bizertensis]